MQICFLLRYADGGEYEEREVFANKTTTIIDGLEPFQVWLSKNVSFPIPYIFQLYEFSVFAQSSVGRGVSSNPFEAQTSEMPPSSAPRLQARALSLNSILVKWEPPDKPNGLITVCHRTNFRMDHF